MTKHTPGPWQQEGMFIRAAGGGYICDIKFPDDDPEIQANARLIAAAPDLLAALMKARVSVATWSPAPTEPLEEIDAAIAKANGVNSQLKADP